MAGKHTECVGRHIADPSGHVGRKFGRYPFVTALHSGVGLGASHILVLIAEKIAALDGLFEHGTDAFVGIAEHRAVYLLEVLDHVLHYNALRELLSVIDLFNQCGAVGGFSDADTGA